MYRHPQVIICEKDLEASVAIDVRTEHAETDELLSDAVRWLSLTRPGMGVDKNVRYTERGLFGADSLGSKLLN
jgi:hypothetical protein